MRFRGLTSNVYAPFAHAGKQQHSARPQRAKTLGFEPQGAGPEVTNEDCDTGREQTRSRVIGTTLAGSGRLGAEDAGQIAAKVPNGNGVCGARARLLRQDQFFAREGGEGLMKGVAKSRLVRLLMGSSSGSDIGDEGAEQDVGSRGKP